jgi:DNA-binding PadR family transcriptional regulator
MPQPPDRLTHADVLVLAMLTARPTHGYDLVTELGRREAGEAPAVSRAQIYYSLKKLQRLRLITPVRDGRAVGITVVTRPGDARVRACVRNAVAALPFPKSPRLDVTRTRFDARGR